MTHHRRMRRASAVTLAVAAATCLGLMVVAGRESPVLLAVLFCGWVLLPFLGLALCFGAAKRLVRTTGVDAAIMGLSIVSVAFYALIAVKPLPAPRAAPYLLAPAVSWLFIGVITARIWSKGRATKAPS
jgi:hypothetical protein